MKLTTQMIDAAIEADGKRHLELNIAQPSHMREQAEPFMASERLMTLVDACLQNCGTHIMADIFVALFIQGVGVGMELAGQIKEIEILEEMAR